MPPRTIRVLVLLEAYTISGSAKSILEFAREARRQSASPPVVQLSLVTFRRRESREQPVLQDAIRDLGITWDVVNEQGRFDRAVIGQLQAIQRLRNPDVVWSNSVKSHFLVRWCGLNRHCGWIAFHHGYTSTNWKMILYNQLDRWSLRSADRLLTVCKPFVAQLEAQGLSSARITIQHMPIRVTPRANHQELLALRSQLGLRDGERIVFTAGRLSREKGHADLLRAFAELRRSYNAPLRLVIAGEGPERGNLVALGHALGLDQAVTLAGHQNHLAPFYGIADVFALPSHSEGSPNVLLEAMVAGVPVVATAVGGVPELAEDGRHAILVPKCDEKAMADGIRRLLCDTALCRRLTASADEVLSRNTPERYYQAIAQVLAETWAKKRGTEKVV